MQSIQSGWAAPPPQRYLNKFAEGYVPTSSDFLKQWHYNMEITECKDPTINSITGENLEFPTSTFYPPGLVCAREFTRAFCSSPGESGSTLMTRDKTRTEKFTAEGILSYVKACDVFLFGQGNTRGSRYILDQQTNNPTAYTKLSCYLPWIAKQYNLKFIPSGKTDPVCNMGTGDLSLNDEGEICRTNPSKTNSTFNCEELPCIFPYYIDGVLKKGCSQFDLEGLNSAVNFCPVRNITTKLNNINNYSSEVVNILTGGGRLCPDPEQQQPGDLLPPLNPNKDECSDIQKRFSFHQCKNNCPGGDESPLDWNKIFNIVIFQ